MKNIVDIRISYYFDNDTKIVETVSQEKYGHGISLGKDKTKNREAFDTIYNTGLRFLKDKGAIN